MLVVNLICVQSIGAQMQYFLLTVVLGFPHFSWVPSYRISLQMKALPAEVKVKMFRPHAPFLEGVTDEVEREREEERGRV